jgi:UDP-N-acetylmuramoyl-L-alanyl-D-glutamate--2,6-diaminopimelate ligase
MKVKNLGEFVSMLKEKGLVAEENIDEHYKLRPVNYISYNSMDVIPGSLFICKGLNFKEKYLQDAIEKGAFCYISEKKMEVNIPYIIVKNMRKVISEVGAFFYDEVWNDHLTMVGITGTKGKSTTATFVKSILDDYCRSTNQVEAGFISGIYMFNGKEKVKAKKMTTPETLQLHKHLAECVENGCKYLVMETSSQALKYDRTAALNYKVVAFLNISEDHISDREHNNMNDYFQSKLDIFDQGEIACVNLEMEQPYLEKVLKEAKSKCKKVITFGRVEGADYYGYDVVSTPGKLNFKVKHNGKSEDIEVSIGGFYNASNALAAISIARALDVPFENIKNGLANVKVAGRMELYTLEDKNVDVIVDYAHNKLSYETLFENVKKLYPDRKIMLVFGCHGNKAYNRRKDLGELANKYADKIVLTEQDAGTESVEDICNQIKEYLDKDKPVVTIYDRGEAITEACKIVEKDWVMVIAGNGADGYQKRGLTYVELPTDGERVQAYILSTHKD